MKKYMVLLALVLLLGISASYAGKENKVYGVGFYNLENLFDTCHDEGKNDYDFLPDGSYQWTGKKYTHKLRNLARVLSEMGTDRLPNVGCAAIGVAEVENAGCLTDLCNQEPLKARNFQFVHIEGPDKRGIDCGLLYNPALFTVRNVKLIPYIYKLPIDEKYLTRGFLTVSGTLAGEHVTIIVNHLPSRAATSYYREEGGRQLRELKDSLMQEDPGVKLIIMGDMNDDPQDKSMAEQLGARREMKDVESPDGLWNPWWNVLASGKGTLKYKGAWNLFDQIIVSHSLLDMKGKNNYKSLKLMDYEIFNRDYLMQAEGKYAGYPLRTHSGGEWLDGYSDHLPTIIYLAKKHK